MTARRRLAIVVAALAGVAVLASGAFLWLVSSERGARLAFEQLGSGLPGKLRVGSIQGSIRGPLRVRDLRYETDRVQIAIDRLAIDWSLRRLASHRIDVRSLEADSVRVVLLTVADSARARDSLGPELPDLDLPLDLTVREGRVRGIYVTPLHSDSAIVIDEIRMSSIAFLDTVGIGVLSVRSRQGSIELRGRARPRGRYAIDLVSRWTLWPGTERETRGGGQMVGDLDTLRFDQRVEAPFVGHVTGVAFRPLRDLSFAARADFRSLDPSWVRPSWPAGRASGSATFSGRPGRLTGRGFVDATTARWGPLHVDYSVENRDTRYRFDPLVVRIPGRTATLKAQGTVVTAGTTPAMDFVGTWRDVPWPLVGSPLIESPAGSFRLRGTVERYRLEGDATMAYRKVPPSPWRFAGTGGPTAIRLQTLEGRPFAGSATGTASIDWGAGRWTLDLAARSLHPETAWRAWPGEVGFDLTARGASGPGGARGDVAIERVTGSVRGQAVTGRAVVAFSSGQYDFSTLEAGWGENRLVASGRTGRTWDFKWDLQAPNLAVVLPHGAGKLQSKGVLLGSGTLPRVQGTASADSVRWGDRWIARLAVDGDVDLSGNGDSRLDAEATEARFERRAIDHGTLHATGRRQDHRLELRVTARDDSMTAVLQGGMPGDTWSGRLTQLDATTRRFGAWSLERPARLVANARIVTVDDLCWRSGAARACANGSWARDGEWRLNGRLDQVLLATLEPWFPAGLDLSGPVDGSVILHGRGTRWLGRAQFDFGPGELIYASGAGQVGRTPFERSSLQVESLADRVDMALSLALGAAGSVRGSFRLPPTGGSTAATAGAPVSGEIHAQLKDLSMVQGFVPQLATTRGTLDADVRLAGTAGRPRWSGNARLAGSAELPRHGIVLSDVVFEARGTEDGRLAFEGSARSGPGRLELRGEATTDARGRPRASATLEGDRFEAMNSKDDGRVIVSPDLTVTLIGDTLRLTGEIQVPEADLHPKARTAMLVPPSADVVYVGADTLEYVRRRAVSVVAEVRLVLGTSVRVRAHGFDVKPTGSVLAIDRPDSPTLGSGELELLSGTYRAYGQNLTIERGRLIFSGPITSPALDIRAVRHARDGVLAGFELRGTLAAPQMTLVSDPPMSDREALGYVVFGRSIRRGNRSEEDLITDAANTLGVQGGSFIAGNLARSFGIDEATIESNGTFKEASLILGTYLSPRIYVNYGVGVVDPVSVVRIQYFLNSKWTLLAETGDESNAEILYTVER